VFPEINFSKYVREILFDGTLFTCENYINYKLYKCRYLTRSFVKLNVPSIKILMKKK